jgi:hypothetical protein
VRSKQPRVQPDAADPLRHEACILAGGHAGLRVATTREQELAGSLVGSLEIIIDGLAGLFAQFKSDGTSSFLLSDRCAIRRVAAGGDMATTPHPRSLLGGLCAGQLALARAASVYAASG